MRIRHFVPCILLGMMLFLCGCQSEITKPPRPTPTPISKPLPAAPLYYFYFSESASYFKRVQGYEFRAEEGKYTAYFYIANEDEPYPVPVDQAWVDTLAGFISQYGMMGWDGFHGSDSMLLDGTHFSISFSFADGTVVRASGYGMFPENYRDASAAIDAHFLQLLPEDMRGW